MNTDLIKRTTLTQLVAAWRESEAEIRQAFGLLVTAQQRLMDVFKPDSYRFRLDRTDPAYREYENPDRVIKELKKDVWRSLIDRMELRRVLSVQRSKELDQQIETGEGLPEIDEVQLIAMLEGTLANVPQFIEEAVKEVFDYLRPHRSHYKTNTEFEIGKRVCLAYAIENWGQTWNVNHYREANIRAIDNVFHALDGNGTVKTTRGPLIDAISSTHAISGAQGETVYFRFRCYKNQSLHLEFKRLDLVAKLNQVAGGMRLKP